MNISESDKMVLLKIGVQINGQQLIIEDRKSNVIYELMIDDIAQFIIKPSLRISKKFRALGLSTLIIFKWDCSRIKMPLEKFDSIGLRSALKRINTFFSTES